MADKQKKVTDEDLKASLTHEIQSSINYDREEISKERARAISYYLGDMKEDTPAPANRSAVISKDVADTINWMMPGIIRTFMASGQIAECEPVGPEDKEAAKQASQYLHYNFMNENDGYAILYEATHDALLQKDGIVKTYWDANEEEEVSTHTNLVDMEIAVLTSDPEVEVLAFSENDDGTFDIKVRRVTSSGQLRFVVIEPENFGINRDANTIEEARFTYHREAKTRSDLIKMGFDKEKVNRIPGDRTAQWSEEELARDETSSEIDDSKDRSTQTIELFECYLYKDVDGDGVSELVKAFFAGDASGGEMLDWEVCEDDNPFTRIPSQPIPHRWDSVSIADETLDMQQVKTVLARQMLDNVYRHNNPQAEVEEGSVINPDALISGKFGQPIIKKKGSSPLIFQSTPFIADKALAALGWADQVIEKRTGVSRATMALDPDALQNQTATANQNAKDSAYSKIELIARNQAEMGWKNVFKKALKLTIKYQDKQKIIRLNNEFIPVDPRSWNADMDITINVGLGTGSRDRDMAMLNNVLMNQTSLIDRMVGYGMQVEAIEMFPKVVKTMIRIGESAGLRNAEDYYPKINEETLARLRQQASQPQQDPRVQAEQQKMQMRMQEKQMDAQIDMQKLQAEIEMDRQRMEADLQLDEEKQLAELNMKREQLIAEIQLKREAMEAEAMMRASGMAGDLPAVYVGGEPG